jgi:hypothetical protein
MSNPFIPASLVTFPYGPSGISGDNITGLANGQAKGLGAVGTALTQYYDDNVAPVRILSGASGVSGSGTASMYVVISEDGANWTNGVNPNSTSDQSALVGSSSANPLPVLQTINVVANATTYEFAGFSIASVLLYMPTYWAIVIYNQSGAAFNGTSSNFVANHTLISFA